MDGYEKLKAFMDSYGALDGGILPYLAKWMTDYVIYYNLDTNLLGNSKQVLYDRSITILDQIHQQEDTTVMCSVKQPAPQQIIRIDWKIG